MVLFLPIKLFSRPMHSSLENNQWESKWEGEITVALNPFIDKVSHWGPHEDTWSPWRSSQLSLTVRDYRIERCLIVRVSVTICYCPLKHAQKSFSVMHNFPDDPRTIKDQETKSPFTKIRPPYGFWVILALHTYAQYMNLGTMTVNNVNVNIVARRKPTSCPQISTI